MANAEISGLTRPRHQWIAIFVVGAFGGMFPTVLRLAIDLDQRHIKLQDVQASTCLAMLIFAFLGGSVASIWNESDLKKVFYLGIGLPSFLTVVASNVQQATAKAYTQLSLTKIEGRQLNLTLPPDVTGEMSVTFELDSGKRQTATFSKPVGFLLVPPSAGSFRVFTRRGDSDLFQIPSQPNTVITVSFRRETDPWYGLKYAFGLQSKPERLVLTTQTVKTQNGPCGVLGIPVPRNLMARLKIENNSSFSFVLGNAVTCGVLEMYQENDAGTPTFLCSRGDCFTHGDPSEPLIEPNQQEITVTLLSKEPLAFAWLLSAVSAEAKDRYAQQLLQDPNTINIAEVMLRGVHERHVVESKFMAKIQAESAENIARRSLDSGRLSVVISDIVANKIVARIKTKDASVVAALEELRHDAKAMRDFTIQRSQRGIYEVISNVPFVVAVQLGHVRPAAAP